MPIRAKYYPNRRLKPQNAAVPILFIVAIWGNIIVPSYYPSKDKAATMWGEIDGGMALAYTFARGGEWGRCEQ